MTGHTEDRSTTAAPGTPSPGPGARPSRPWWRRAGPVAALVAAVAVIVLVVALVAIGDGDGDTTTAATSTTAGETPAATTAPAGETPATAAPGGAPTEPGDTPATEPALEDGRHPVHLTGLDAGGGTVTFDLIQFLTGDEATEAYHREVPDDPGPPPNDYWIVNDNPRLRELPVAADAAVTVLADGFEPRAITLAELPAHLAGDLSPEPERIWHNPFWLTVEGGTVTALEEQYLP